MLISYNELEKTSKELLKHEKITIPKNLFEIIENAIVREAQEIGYEIYAIAVCSNHVHIIVDNIGIGYSVGRFKKAATKTLRKCGFDNKVWTKGFDKRYCYHQHELETKIKYVNRHKK